MHVIGTLDFRLDAMVEPVSVPWACSMKQLDRTAKISDLFKKKRMKGWWPAYELDKEGNEHFNVGYWVTWLVGTSALMLHL